MSFAYLALLRAAENLETDMASPQYAADGSALNLEAAQANLQKAGAAQATASPAQAAQARLNFAKAQAEYSKHLNASQGGMDTHSLIDFLHPAPQGQPAPKR